MKCEKGEEMKECETAIRRNLEEPLFGKQKRISFELEGYDYFASGDCKFIKELEPTKNKDADWEYLVRDFGIHISKAPANTVYFKRISGECSLWKRAVNHKMKDVEVLINRWTGILRHKASEYEHKARKEGKLVSEPDIDTICNEIKAFYCGLMTGQTSKGLAICCEEAQQDTRKTPFD